MSSRRSELTDDEAARAHRVLRAVWIIVSAFHRDAVAGEVAAMGERLRLAIERGDRVEAKAAVQAVRTWLSTRAGVVTSRLCQVFELDDDGDA